MRNVKKKLNEYNMFHFKWTNDNKNMDIIIAVSMNVGGSVVVCSVE